MKNKVYCHLCDGTAEWIVLSVNLAYWYCRDCKVEVHTREFVPNVASKAMEDWTAAVNEAVRLSFLELGRTTWGKND